MTTYLDTLLGQSGRASFTVSTASYTQPVVNGSVTIAVLDSSWVPVGVGLFIAVGGAYLVTAVPDSTHITVQNLGTTGNAAPAATVPTAQRVASSGVAGATGPVGPTGTPAIAPVDILVTSNVAVLSGAAQTFDGIAATAGKRLLLVGQTAAAQNGIYTAAAGAWVYGFAVDADVVAALGVFVYVRPGGLSVPTEGVNYQLATGSTVAGAKTYAKASTAVAIAPVDYAQIQSPFYYTFTYSSGAKTLTADSNGVVPTVIFGATPSVGQSVEMRVGFPVDLADTRNGIYVITSIGSAGTPFVAVRRSDFDSTADLARGATYPVRLGPLAGTLRTMTTAGPTLDTTPIALGPATSKSTLIIDLSSYGVKDFASFNDWFYNGNIGLATSQKVNQALWDYRGTRAILRVPAGNGGNVFFEQPIDLWGGTELQFLGREGATVQRGAVGGQPAMTGGAMFCAYNCATYPQIGGVQVDTATNAAPISLWKDTGAAAASYMFNLQLAGLATVTLENIAQFECKVMFRLDALTAGTGLHIVSCRGRRSTTDTTDAMFSLQLNTLNKIDATLRARDTTAGVYGAVSQVGSGTCTVTGDGAVKPTEDATLVIKVLVGGTRGAADSKSIKYSTNNGRTWSQPILLGAATSLTVTDVNDNEQPFTAKLNFGAGTFIANDTYTTVCSGVNQIVSLNHALALSINTNYCATLQLVGGNARLNVGLADGSTASTTVTAAATGGMNSFYWETPVIGWAGNAELGCANADIQPLTGQLGSIRILTSNVTALTTAAAATALTAHVAGQVFFWRPCNSSGADKMNDPGGSLRRWIGYLSSSLEQAYIDPIRITGTTAFVSQYGGLGGATIDLATTKLSGTWFNTWAQKNSYDLRIKGGNTGFNNVAFAGSDFNSDARDISIEGGYGHSISVVNCALKMSGNWSIVQTLGKRVSFIGCTSAITQGGGTFFINTETQDQNVMCLSNCYGKFECLDIDTENQAGAIHGGIIYCTVSSSLEINGNWDLIGAYTLATVNGLASGGVGKLLLNITGAFGATSKQYVDTKQSGGNVTLLAPHMPIQTIVPLSSRAGKVLRAGSRLPATTLTGTTNTLTWAQYGSFKRAAANLAANGTQTLSPTGMLEGDTFTITMGAQGFTDAYVNGGPSGGTLFTAAVGFVGTLTFRMNFAGDLEWV